MVFSANPKSWFIENVNDLDKWSPKQDPYNRAELTPLQIRASLPDAPRLMNWHDMTQGFIPGGDQAPQGTHGTDFYNFSYWQYVDILAYMFHGFLACPPPSWINAGHKNGVKVLGNITTREETPADSIVIPTMLEQSDHYIKQLGDMANYYGFDGWAWNLEHALPGAASATQLIAFLRKFKQQYPNLCTIWYDSIIVTDGSVKYQNALNDKNKPFFDVCDGIFLNYWWDLAKLQSSAGVAGARKRDVYVGIQMDQEQIDQLYDKRLVPISKAELSVGLYGPAALTYQVATDAEPSDLLERKLWVGNPPYNVNQPANSISKAISIRPCSTQLPVISVFDTGKGRGLYIDGVQAEKCFNKPAELRWGNMSAQSLIPDMRLPVSWPNNQNPPLFKADFTFDWAWDGGSSLRVWNDVPGSGGNNFSVIDLFPANTPFSTATDSVVVSCKLDGSKRAPKIEAVLYGGGNSNITALITPTNDGKPQVLKFSGSSNMTVRKIQIRCEATYVSSVLLGMISIIKGPAQFTGSSVKNIDWTNQSSAVTSTGNLLTSFDLVWDAGSVGDRHYNVYYSNVKPSGNFDSCWLLGRSFVTRFYCDQFRFDKGVKSAYFVVQPMDKNGFTQPLAECAATVFEWKAPVTTSKVKETAGVV